MKLLLAILFALVLVNQPVFALEQFPTEQQAQAHCPDDTVVWLNTKTGVWHYKGQRWYGNTKEGAYVCLKEAAEDGDRATHNGQ